MNQDTNKSSGDRPWWSRYSLELLFAIGGILAVNAIFLADAFRESDSISASGAGQLGDFVGGYIGTLFLLVSILLLYKTLKNQRTGYQLQSFESRFFELIKIHRDNVAEMQVQETHGRRVFIKLYHELQATTEIVRQCVEEMEIELDQKQILRIAYYCLFYGVGDGASPMLKHALHDIDQSLFERIDMELQDDAVCQRVKRKYSLGYKPFEGHQSRLGHYYRHLYQSVCYVDRRPLQIDKYDYVRTLRAQLTTHEQALLLVNSLTPIGSNWWKHDLIKNYRMVKNLPRHFVDRVFDIEAAELFPKGYFEWEETSSAS